MKLAPASSFELGFVEALRSRFFQVQSTGLIGADKCTAAEALLLQNHTAKDGHAIGIVRMPERTAQEAGLVLSEIFVV